MRPVVRTGSATVQAVRSTTATAMRTVGAGASRRVRQVARTVADLAGRGGRAVAAVGEEVAGVGKGAYEGVAETVSGLAHVATNPTQLVKLGQALYDDPVGTGKALVGAIVNPIVEDVRNGNYGEAGGRIAVGVLDVLFGAKGGAKVAGALGKVGRKASSVASPAVRRAATASRTAIATRAARWSDNLRATAGSETVAISFGGGLARTGSPRSVALDSSTARALTSADQTVARRLESQLAGCNLIMCQTAVNEYQGAVARLAGPSEKAAADALMRRVTVVPDNPSARVAGLRQTRSVQPNDIQIFGTADRMGIPIFTSDAAFLRGAAAQGVELDAFVHPSVSFRGL